MNLPLFNYTDQLLNIIGITKNEVEEKLNAISGKHFITNPILATLARTFFGNKYDMSIISVADNDLLLTRLTGHILGSIRQIIEDNQNYKLELKRKFLSHSEGPFFSVYNELFVCGYLEYLGYSTRLSSSKDSGKPDIFVSGENGFSSDVKTFPDMEFWLLDQIDILFPEIIDLINKSKNFYVMIFVTNTKNFKKEFPKLMVNLLSTGKAQNGLSCMIVNMPNYQGSQGYSISNNANNVTFRFVPNFSYDEKSFSDLTDKATKQQQSMSNEGITWIMFPHPKPNNIERRLVWEVSGLPKRMQDQGIGLVLYEMFAEVDQSNASRVNLHSGADFLLKDKFSQKINRLSFDEFISSLLSIPTIIIR